MARLTIGRCRSFWGELRPPGDKSLTHRAYMIGALCRRGGVVRKPLLSEDCGRTRSILEQIGASIAGEEISAIAPRDPAGPLYCGNSGTTMRLMTGILCGLGISCELTGDESLSRRPMRRIVEPLRQMGADITGDRPPLTVRPASLRGIAYESPIASAQVKSAALLAGLFAEGETSVTEPSLSRDHTERMLAAAGCVVIRDGLTVNVAKGLPERLEMTVPGDISSAAYFLVGAALHGGPVTAREVGVNPTRTGILEVLDQVGAGVFCVGRMEQQGEPVADVTVERTGELRPFEISGEMVPRLIDEIPILAVLATQCHGTSIIKDAAELRVKESDRLDTVADALLRMGAGVEVFEDGMAITGPTPLAATTVDAKSDHRIAMSFAIAGTIADGETTIEGAESTETSFPDFLDELKRFTHEG